MKRTLHSWYLVALIFCSALIGGCAYGPSAPLLYADSGVKIERPSQGEVRYEYGMVLRTGDIIETTTGYAVIDFDNDNVVALRTNTRIQLGSIKLFFGEVFARINQIVQRGGGQVTTDEVSASVKGTEYSVRRSLVSGRTDLYNAAVIVRRGQVWCEDPHGRWAALQVNENNLYRVDNGQTPRPLQSVNAQAETAWADDVIRRLFAPRAPELTFPGFPGRAPQQQRQPTPPPPPPPRSSPG